jgi:hypothetical protein
VRAKEAHLDFQPSRQLDICPCTSVNFHPLARAKLSFNNPDVRSVSLSNCKALNLERVRDLSAVLGEFDHHLLLQPDIHPSRVVHIASVIQFLCKFLARRQAAIQFE